MTRLNWPGLVDLQVNGFAGHDVNDTNVTHETISALARALWAEGTTTFLPTVITATEEAMTRSLRAIAEARRRDPLVAHSIAGIHIEGPSLSTGEGFRGAHDPLLMRDPDLAELDRWQEASDGIVRIVTLAPERTGALEYIAAATRRGIVISLGHCAPSSDIVHAAARAGARLSTHLGNGTAANLPRHPNHVWAQLADDALTAMLITDGHHLPADTATAMIRAKGTEHSILTSDSAALAGSPPGTYRTAVGGEVVVSASGALTLAGSDLLAGSGSSLRGCLEWARARLPIDDSDLLAMATTNPARLIGLNARAADGGDRITVDLRSETISVTEVRVAGEIVHRAPSAHHQGEL